MVTKSGVRPTKIIDPTRPLHNPKRALIPNSSASSIHAQKKSNNAKLTSTSTSTTTTATATAPDSTELPIIKLSKSQIRRQNKKKAKSSSVQLTSSEKRNLQYLKDAGLKSTEGVSSEDVRREMNSSVKSGQSVSGNNVSDDGEDESSNSGSSDVSMAFARKLSNPSAKIRNQTINTLELFLLRKATHSGLTEVDLQKLWKSLFYCLWLSDKRSVQDEVSLRFARMVGVLGGSQEGDEEAMEEWERMIEDGGGEEEEHAHKHEHEHEHKHACCRAGVCGSGKHNHLHAAEAEGEEDGEGEEDVDDLEDDNDEFDEDEMNASDFSSESESEDQPNEEEHGDEEEDGEDSDADSSPPLPPSLPLSLSYLSTYFTHLSLTWPLLDQYRLDKFYTLTRLLLREVYRYMARTKWRRGGVGGWNDVLFYDCLSVVNEMGVVNSQGIRFHVIDIAMDELALVLSEDTNFDMEQVDVDFLTMVLEPFIGLSLADQDPTIYKRVNTEVIQKFIKTYSNLNDYVLTSTEPTDPVEISKIKCFENVDVLALGKFFFTVAGGDDVGSGNRRELYNIEREIKLRIIKIDKLGGGEKRKAEVTVGKVEKKVKKSKVEVVLEVAEEEEEEVVENDGSESSSDSDSDSGSGSDSTDAVDKEDDVFSTPKENEEEEEEEVEEDEVKSIQRLSKKERKQQKTLESMTQSLDSKFMGKESPKTESANAIANVIDMPGMSEAASSSSSSSSPKEAKRVRKGSVDIYEMNNSDDENVRRASSPAPTRETRSAAPNDKKKVHFGAKNYSRGYKASMKGLSTLDVAQKSSSPKPDRGVLRLDTPVQKKTLAIMARAKGGSNEAKKDAKAPKSPKGAKRKKATDYF